MTTKPPARRTGGRSARVREAVLNATLALIEENGVAELTVAQIAARAGVHETSIYRRWGDPRNLANEALQQIVARAIPHPDTGSLRGDLIAMHTASLSFIQSAQGRGLLSWAVAAPRDDAHDPPVALYWLGRAELMAPLFDRARAKGEWTSDEDMPSVMARLTGPLYFRNFFLREAIGAAEIEAMVEVFLSGG
jgi:AcrR family transcriptional regulator